MMRYTSPDVICIVDVLWIVGALCIADVLYITDILCIIIYAVNVITVRDRAKWFRLAANAATAAAQRKT